MTDPDPFDEIVRNLDLDLDFPEPESEAAPELGPNSQPVLGVPPACGGPSAASTDGDEPFYRRVESRPILPRNPRVLFAWLGVIGAPLWMILSSVAHVIMPRPVLLGCGLVFVASAIYLIAQLPERGPSEPWWPDDGAQL